MTANRRLRLALVVPSLAGSGGVQAVGRFLRSVALRSGVIDLRLVSLSEWSRDPMSLLLTAPSTWWRGAAVARGTIEGLPFDHVGAVAGELEFQRYKPRQVLGRVLADCDVIQIVCGFPAWANTVVGLGKPVAMHVATRARVERRQRDARPTTAAGIWRKMMTTVTDRLDDRALRSVTAIQVMNPWMLEYARSLNNGRSVDVRYLPPGIDAETFRPAIQRGGTDRYVLWVGRPSDPRKNLGLLLDAFALLPDHVRSRTRIVLAGSPPFPEDLLERAVRLGVRDRLDLIENPDQPALLRLYQGASVLALPSDEEGFGMVLLEAMACAVPVVSTRSGGPDGIVTDREDGFLVPRDDAPAFSGRLAELLQNDMLATEMGRNGRRTIEERFDQSVVGRSFVEIWQRLGSA